MRVTFILVGKSILKPPVLRLKLDNLHITQIETSYSRRRTYRINLVDVENKTIPLSRCLIPEGYLNEGFAIGTGLEFDTKDDKEKHQMERVPRGTVINCTTTMFTNKTFATTSEQLNSMNRKYEEKIVEYGKKLKAIKQENEARVKTVTDPFKEIIDLQQEQIKDLMIKNLVIVSKIEEQITNTLVQAMREELSSRAGVQMEEIEVASTRIDKQMKERIKEIKNTLPQPAKEVQGQISIEDVDI